MRRRADRLLPIGIKNDNIGVGTHGNRAFARKQTEDLSRSCRCQFDKTIQADPSLSNASVEDKAQPILHTRAAVRNFREIIAAEFLLFFEAERTMVSGNHLQVINSKSLPQLLLVGF